MEYKRNISPPTPYIFIDYSDLAHLYDFSDTEPMVFQITSTFANTKNTDEEKWKSIADPINKFFAIIHTNDQYRIIKTIDTAVKTLKSEFHRIESNPSQMQIIGIMKQVGSIIVGLDDQINLCRKLHSYVNECIYIGDFSNAGMNAQDRPVVTYREEEAKELVAICMLSKLLFPIFGKILNQFEEYTGQYSINRSKKEVYTSIILDDILRKGFPIGFEKLSMYVYDYVLKQYNDLKLLIESSKHTAEDDNAFYNKDAFKHFTAGAFMGLTTDSLTESTLANLLVKAFVNGNVHDNERSHVITYVHRAVSLNISKQLAERTGNRRIYRRTDPSKSSDNESAQFDVDSVVSNKPCDITAIIETEITNAVREIVPDELMNVYNNILHYHRYNRTPLNTIAQSCLSKFFGPYLGGGESILYLAHEPICQLLSAFQIYLMEMKLDQLMFAVSAKSIGLKISPTIVDNRIINGHKTLDNYSYCANIKFKHFDGIFKKSVQRIINALVEQEYINNLPDIIYDRLNIPNINGGLFEYDLILLNQIFLIMRI